MQIASGWNRQAYDPSVSLSFLLLTFIQGKHTCRLYFEEKELSSFWPRRKKLGPMSFLCQGYIFIEGCMKKRFRESLLEFIFLPCREEGKKWKERGRAGGRFAALWWRRGRRKSMTSGELFFCSVFPSSYTWAGLTGRRGGPLQLHTSAPIFLSSF